MNRLNIELEDLNYDMEEEFKTLRTNLMFCGVDKKVILITSTFPGEGKTEKSVYLSAALAKMNKKVLLLDMDLRKSVLVSSFEMGKVQYGMSHFLSGQCPLSDVICATNVPKLHVAVAGPSTPNTTELLASEKFHKMLESLKDVYDYIIIDSAPLGLVIDAAIIAKECDGAVLVIESGKTKYRLVQEVKAKIENSGCPVLGAVLSKVEVRKGGYYGKKYGQYYGHNE